MDNTDLIAELAGEFQIDGGFHLAEMASRLPFNRILDVGFGHGAASRFFRLKGKEVVAIDRDVQYRDAPLEIMKKEGIEIVESSFEDYQPEGQIDAIWLSHVLEHTLDVGQFLKKARSILSEKGWLFVMVPPFKHEVVGGHVTPGWNIGVLMYVLLVCGFDIKNGHFVKHGYSICAFVQKSSVELPVLCHDQGDIERTRDLWPLEVHQGFDGRLTSVNWFEDEDAAPES
ncbi:class I SAM-dependent methyltransferase [Pontiellaceae bacterium B12227]|nr:class I SAM-dependent methyltransferase [Pontiellaceae bacterium B12227]